MSGLCKIEVMMGAIDFHYQSCHRRIEIDNIVANRLLSVELHTENLLSP